jgi:hypothetical protein
MFITGGSMRRFTLLVAGLLLTTAGPALAQDTSKGEVSGGWRYYHTAVPLSSFPFSTALLDNDYPKGWYADVSGNLSPKFAIVGEVGGTYYRKNTSSGVSVVTEESRELKIHTFMGGIRVRAPQNARIVPFGQVLFGGEHDSTKFERVTTFNIPNFNNPPPSRSTSEMGTSDAMLAMDGGVTVKAGFLGVRGSVGYARFFGTTDADMLRISIGAVVRY